MHEHYDEIGAARRIETPHENLNENENLSLTTPARAPPRPPAPAHWPDATLATAAGDYLTRRRADLLSDSTIQADREMLWSVIEFVACDTPLRELMPDTAQQYLQWLRVTPSAPRKPRSLPKQITPASVSAFLTWPPKRTQTAKHRNEQTIGRYWRHAKPFFRGLGLAIELTRRQRPRMALPPNPVPTRKEVVRWWQEYLGGAAGTATAAERHRVVLTQGFVLLTGMRVGEALAARLEDLEGYWLLVRESKTHTPRILFVNGQALAIAATLRDRYTDRLLFPKTETVPLVGWCESKSWWHSLVQSCGPAPHAPEKPHQALRQVLSGYLHAKDGKDKVAEAAQLGHGVSVGVVFKHYLDVLKRLPKLLQRVRLPLVDGLPWPAPIEAAGGRPIRLIREFRRLVNRGE